MGCFKPLKAIQCGKKPNGKQHNEFISAYCKKNNIQTPQTEQEFIDFSLRWRKKIIDLPCGQCLGCRLEYSRQWAMRCVAEAKDYQHNAFITLTYAPKHRPARNTLVKKHLSNFMKDLRRYWKYHYRETGIRFYAAGEYTPINGYPHYHIGVFNIKIDDLYFYKMTETKEPLYISPTIEKIWGKGYITVGSLTWNSAAYIARYITKKIKGQAAKEHYKKLGILPEFTQMSRRPGIGWSAFDKLKENYEEARMLIKTNKGVQHLRPCRYYDKLYDLERPEDIERIREAKRILAEMREELRKQRTSTDEFHYRRIQEESLKQRIKILDRNKII